MTESIAIIAIYEELFPKYLAQVHNWLMDDVIEAMTTSIMAMEGPLEFLREFSFLIYSANTKYFTLVDEKDDSCIGVILFEQQSDALEVKLFAIAPEYRGKKWGHRFVLTTIPVMRHVLAKRSPQVFDLPVRVYPFNETEVFWSKIGFDRIDECMFELKREIPFEPIP
jgi:N-acetylglutamate synthase-like GNAT family acetyltransferase